MEGIQKGYLFWLDHRDEPSFITNFDNTFCSYFTYFLERGSVQNDIGCRHGSRINSSGGSRPSNPKLNCDRFPKRSPKVVGGGGCPGAHIPGKLFGFSLPKVTFLGVLSHSDRILARF